MSTIQTLDCRGQQCPAPILATARAAKSFGEGGGTLEILADDDAFPLDLRSWCRASGASVVELKAAGDFHRAIVQVGTAQSTVKAANRLRVDCRGMECPKPILMVARAARSHRGELEVLADDDAFEMDINSWCRTSKAHLASLERKQGVYRAIIELPLAASTLKLVPEPTTPAPATSLSPVSQLHVVDCRGMECPQPVLEVARAARKRPGVELEVLADDDAFEVDIQSWCRSSKATLLSMERHGPEFRARIQLQTEPAKSEALVPSPSSAPPQALPGQQTMRVDLRALPPSEWLVDLDYASHAPRATQLEVFAADRQAANAVLKWCASTGHELIALSGDGPIVARVALRQRLSGDLEIAHGGSTEIAVAKKRRATILVLHNDKEALLAALLVANGAASQGLDVMMYFTFWGLNLLRGDAPNPLYAKEKVSWAQRLFKWLMPKGPKRQGLGKLNFGGMGSGMMNSLMKKKNVMDLPELIDAAQEQDVRFVACTMAMGVMGVTKRELHPYDNLEYGGVAAFVESAANSEMSLVF